VSPARPHNETTAANDLRTRQRRGLIRKTSNLRGDPPPDRFLTWVDLFDRGVVSSKTQARRLWERGLFPKPVHISERCIAWRESEINAWIAAAA
jgi:predicted DNA-binding transcriptional regulator AlpA